VAAVLLAAGLGALRASQSGSAPPPTLAQVIQGRIVQRLAKSDRLILVRTNRVSEVPPSYRWLSTTREDLATGLTSILDSVSTAPSTLSYSLARWCRGVSHGMVYPFVPGSLARLHVVGQGTVDGQPTIQLTGTDTTPAAPKTPCLLDGPGPQQPTAPPVLAPGFVRQHWQVDVWVNRSTYLPVRTVTEESGRSEQVDLRWLPRTHANLARLHLLCPNPANGFCHPFGQAP
jgi:hypothetical protein